MSHSLSCRPVGAAAPAQQQHVPKYFDILPYPPMKVRVHPVVVVTIADAYLRREEGQRNVIGTLLGSVSDGNVIEVSDCFVDRHSLTDEGLLQIIKDHHETMYELKQQVSGGSSCPPPGTASAAGGGTAGAAGGGREVVVGWFCTGSEMTELTCAIHGWFKQFSSVSKFYPQPPLTEPLHLMVNTTMDKGHLSIKAYMQVPLIMAKEACFQFHELPLELFSSAADRAGLSLLLKVREASRRQRQQQILEAGGPRSSALWWDNSSSMTTSPVGAAGAAVAALTEPSPAPGIPVIKQGMEAALEKLSEQLSKSLQYVRGVLNGTERADSDIGRFLSRAVCTESVHDIDVFDQMCQNALQDNLMVVHLTNLARLQFSVAERLNTSFF